MVPIGILLAAGLDMGIRPSGPESNGWGLIHLACKSGNTERVEWCLDKGVDVDQPTLDEMYTPLMIACLYRHTSMVAFLLSKKVERVCMWAHTTTTIALIL